MTTAEAREEFARRLVVGSSTDLVVRTIVELIELVEDFTDEDACRFDHNGDCQAHGWFETDPKCPHARAKELLSAMGVTP